MEISVKYDDKFRISCDGGNNFINVHGLEWGNGIAIDAFPWLHYIEIRQKERHLRTFYFKSKSHKKETDLGWWKDAEVVWSMNNVRHDNK